MGEGEAGKTVLTLPNFCEIIKKGPGPGQELFNLIDVCEGNLRSLDKTNYGAYLTLLLDYALPEDRMKLADKYLVVIADRFATDTDVSKDAAFVEKTQAIDISEQIAMLIRSLAFDGYKMQPEIIKKFYKYIHSENRLTQLCAWSFIGDLVVLDERNEEDGKNIGINELFYKDFIERLRGIKNARDEMVFREMADAVWADFGGEGLTSIIVRVVSDVDGEIPIKIGFSLLANRIGFENARLAFQDKVRLDPEFKDKWEKIEKILRLNPAEKPTPKQQDLYEVIDFSKYRPNKEVNESEAKFLTNEFKDKDRILDIGCGTGRLMLKLMEAKKNVTGVDFMKKHIAFIKSINPKAKAVVGSWHNLPFKNQAFDAVYCLGRSFLHNTTIGQGLEFLYEARRVLSNEGSLIMDIPDITKGSYAESRDRLEKAARDLGISYKEYGSIIDSPDNIYYLDRFVPLPDQFRAMAALAGFDAEIIKEHEFEDIENNKNINLYWKLTKKKVPLSQDERQAMWKKLKTSGPLLSISII